MKLQAQTPYKNHRMLKSQPKNHQPINHFLLVIIITVFLDELKSIINLPLLALTPTFYVTCIKFTKKNHFLNKVNNL